MGGDLAFFQELAEARRAGRPRVWRRPLAPVVSSAEVFQWLIAGTRMRPRRIGLRVYGEHGVEAPSEWHAPIADDASMAGYLARLGARIGEVGIVVNDFQAATPEVWRRAQALLGRVFAEVGMPAGGASFEIFSGAYRRGAFGVHKDDQDVITFVVEGPKRFRVWPFERFAGRPEVPRDGRERPCSLGRLEDADGDALVLEGEPGDVLYWPADWWHVAESDGEQCTTVGLGLFRGHTAERFVEQAVHAAGDRTTATLPFDSAGALAATRAVLDRLVAQRELAARLEERVLAFATAFGCRSTPAPLATSLPAAPLRLAVPGALRWAPSTGDRLVWAVGGTAFRYPAARAIVALLERVGSGAPFVAAALVAELVDDEVEPDALVHVLTLLHAHHALIPA